ncbi:hypothetical protein L9W84_12910 [Vibrio aestuarianus]|nr:hypothetical protein [Vibrio aestuarianus]MDE1214519.1 hypothetical protein [Vibrio aestuarianus]MDE1270491.1 hypothetical protein [Vibrio aestuarianus]MDE1292641.1 hypothetical protein [Vibrio aestuarianus]MDE1306240.1 hypothetical protein [Vibrio aestuarianus]MDH5890619.1 hypothetical protein [Vibrio aestuarianus]
MLNEALNYAIRLTKGPNYVSHSSNHFLPSVIKRRASPYASRKIVFHAGETVMILSWFQQQQNHRYWLVDRKLHKQALQQNGGFGFEEAAPLFYGSLPASDISSRSRNCYFTE